MASFQQILQIFWEFQQIFSATFQKYFRKSFHGSILIEFAFSIPILIILLLFALDHYRFYELKNKVKTSAYLAASMIQQISNIRTEKQLTKEDFGRITYISCLNFFHTNTMFKPWPFGVFPVLICYWVKRVNANNYQFQRCYSNTAAGTEPGVDRACDNPISRTLDQIKSTHPDLVCDKDGDERVLVRFMYRTTSNFSKDKIGFFLLNPKTFKMTYAGATNNLFAYELVITPKPGLFPGK